MSMATRWTLIGLGTLLLASQTLAVPVLLQDKNSSALIDPTGPLPYGNYSWTVDGVEQLALQWFWYRIGNNPESALHTLPLVGQFSVDTNPFTDVRADSLSVLHRAPGLMEVETVYTLRGGNSGSRQSDLMEGITIRNLSAAPLPITFFQYADFNVQGTPNDDSLYMPYPNTARQNDPVASVSETVVTPTPTHHQVDLAAPLLAMLNDAAPTVLNDLSGPLGPADVAWAFQWDFLIPAGGSVLISKDKQITPEPATMVLIFAGLAGWGLRRRRGV